MFKSICSGPWFTATAKKAAETFEIGKQKEAPPQCSTFEELAHILEQAQRSLKWTPMGEHISICIGHHQTELVFAPSDMREHSLYFRFFSLPLTCWANTFRKDTERLMHVTVQEADMLKWIVNWGHFALPQPLLIHRLYRDISFDEWCMIWVLADILQMELLQDKVHSSLHHMLAEDRHLPSASAINYMCKHAPYRQESKGNWLYHWFVLQYSFLPDDSLVRAPGAFSSKFVQDVLVYLNRDKSAKRKVKSKQVERKVRMDKMNVGSSRAAKAMARRNRKYCHSGLRKQIDYDSGD